MKTKRNYLSLFSIALLLLLSAIILFACDKQEVKREYVSSGNGSVITETIDGKKIYRAVPDQWHEFVGWYNGRVKYSTNEVLSIKNNTPSKMEARFASSAKQTFNRHLEGFYNEYIDGEGQDGEYFNYSLSSTLNYSDDNKCLNRTVSINGYIDYQASSQFAFEVKNENKIDFALYYLNNDENGTIYVQVEDDKFSFTDMGLLTNIFQSLPHSSNTVWSMDSLVSDEDTKYLINQYFGIANSMAFINEVINTDNSSTIEIRYHKILNLLKNIADNSSDASTLQNLIYALTCEYQSSSLPEMILTFTTNFEKVGNSEYVKDIEIKFDLNKNYIVNFNDKKYTLPKMNVTLKIDSFNYQLSTNANAISSDVLSSFPQPTVNMINVHTDGELNFINATDENEKIIVDKYLVEFDADINPLALISFKKERERSYHDIEWDKLGFLSFKVSLVAETEPSAFEQQQLRHNQDYTSLNNRFGYQYNDYINILIDTKNNGANAYVYLGLYTPYTPFTRSYIFNHSFNIPSLIDMLESGNDKQNSINSKTILNMLTTLIAGGMQLENSGNVNEIFKDLITDLLNSLNVDSQILENNFNYTNSGFELSLSQIRNKIRNFESETLYSLLGLSNVEIKLDKILFGDDQTDKITEIALNMNPAQTNVVSKNNDGNYLSGDGEVLIDEFNNAHKVLTGISSDSGITELASPISRESLLALKGSQTAIENAILSDGSIVSEFINNKGQTNNTAYKKIIMIIEDIEILSLNNGMAQIRVLLQFKDYSNSIGNLGDELYELTGIPYGLIVYETTVKITN